MKRKVIQIAGSTQLVSLPRAWALAHNVKKGDEVEVEADGAKIIISTEKKPELEKLNIVFPKEEQFLRRLISSPYIHGYDELEAQFGDPSAMGMIQKTIDECLGYEIVSQTSDSCTIKSVVSASEGEFDSMFRKAMIMLVEMAKDSYSAIQEKDYHQLPEIQLRERTHNKLTNFCLRLLNKHGYKNYKKITTLYTVVCQIENIVDCYRDICKYVASHKPNLSKQFLTLYSSTVQLTESFYDTMFKYELSKAIDFKTEANTIRDSCIKIFKSKRGNEPILAYYLLQISDRMHHALVYLA
jgi:phosphate uptake regulator